MKKNRHISTVFILLLFAAGLAILSYPAVSSRLAERNQTRAIQEYKVTVSEWTAKQIADEWSKAQEYNDMLSGTAIADPFLLQSGYVLPKNYESILNLNGTMAYLEIPKISVSLPIYHGTGEDVLNKGVGHLYGTSLPIGGKNSHAVLTGHRGLPSSELFTNLDQLEIGDRFYIHVLDETLAYEIDQILTVEPSDTEQLRPVSGMDYVTLVTCTPYGINSHRLLIRGVRVPYDADDAALQAASTVSNLSLLLFILSAVSVIAAVVLWISVKRWKHMT